TGRTRGSRLRRALRGDGDRGLPETRLAGGAEDARPDGREDGRLEAARESVRRESAGSRADDRREYWSSPDRGDAAHDEGGRRLMMELLTRLYDAIADRARRRTVDDRYGLEYESDLLESDHARTERRLLDAMAERERRS